MRSAARTITGRLGAAVLVSLLTVGLVAGLPAREAAAAPVLPSGFVLRDQPSGQAAFDLTDFAYLPDGSVVSTGKLGKLAWASADGSRSRQLAMLEVDPTRDSGLVGIAVAPDYTSSRAIYLARSVPQASGSVLRLERWQLAGTGEPTGLVQGSAQTLLQIPAGFLVHGLTGIIPAEDGTLWVSIGDTSDFEGTDPAALRAQDINQPQGKILRIQANGDGVPSNPYYDPAAPGAVRSKVYAFGFRSPFRLTLDPRTGLPVVGDVGYQTWEEIDIVRPGGNYGWPCWEGRVRTPGYRDLPGCAGVPNTDPLVAYHHGSGPDQGNSVTGGVVYTGTNYPERYHGAYFYADYSGKRMWTVAYDAQGNLTRPPENPPFGSDIGGPVKFATGPGGDIVYADIYSGQLRRLSYVPGNAEPIAKATTSTDPATRTVTFDASESLDFNGDPLTYRWDFGDGPTGTGVRATHTYGAGAERFTARLTVTDPLGATGTVDLTVVPGNHSPVITPETPEDVTYAVGDPVTVQVSATDTEDGALDVTWTSSTVHCAEADTCHFHPGPAGEGATFTVPFTNHPDSRMELTATATDSAGVSTTYTYRALPREYRVTLTSTVPAALEIPAEGTGGPTAMVTEGADVEVRAATIASDGGSRFVRWDDGVTEPSQTFTMPARDVHLTAIYASPIDSRYEAEPELREVLGEPVGPEVIDGGVRYRTYEGGRLYWTQATGVKAVYGAIYDKYLALGGHRVHGVPTTDESATPDGTGRYNHFTGMTGTGMPTSIYWTASTGAHGVWGAIRDRWRVLGWERGPLGYPTTDESVTPDGRGRYNHFSKSGSIYWTAGTGARDVYGAIRQRWAALGWERSYLGYPTSGEFAVPGGRRNNFQRGYIQWNSSTGAVIDRRY
ncbi:PQQ-dependent sugar dehydrogenase [Prauserella oleivorans]|uniref:PQQ-dependent sugar dehydrogenase n=1 Tax=Prauserella oleivorans TaxID=1478153 RepID=UPI00361FFAC5